MSKDTPPSWAKIEPLVLSAAVEVDWVAEAEALESDTRQALAEMGDTIAQIDVAALADALKE